jgi:hypothetical protein
VQLNRCAVGAAQLEIDLAYASELGANSTPFVVVRDPDGTTFNVTDRTLDGIRAAVYRGRLMLEPAFATVTPSPVDLSPEPTVDATAAANRATEASELADLAATQAMAGRMSATPTP